MTSRLLPAWQATKRFCCSRHPLTILAAVLAAYLLFVFGLVPRGLRWPWRLLLIAGLIFGYARLLYHYDNPPRLAWILAPLRHPLTLLVGFVAFSLWIHEFFPFSHFPMYGNPDSESEYFYLAQETPAGSEPVAIHALTRLTSSKFGKMYRSTRKDYCDAHDIDDDDLTAEQTQEIGAEVLDYVYELAGEFDKAPKDATWQLMEVKITMENNKLRETPYILATRKFP